MLEVEGNKIPLSSIKLVPSNKLKHQDITRKKREEKDVKETEIIAATTKVA